MTKTSLLTVIIMLSNFGMQPNNSSKRDKPIASRSLQTVNYFIDIKIIKGKTRPRMHL